MRPKSNTIELNGKRYDAKTGKVVTGSTIVKPGSKPAAAKTGGNIDGFSRRPKTVTRNKTTATAVHRKTEKSKTLMRNVVKKPAAPKPKAAIPAVKKSRPSIHMDIDPKRISRAKTVHKSPLVSKFGGTQKRVRPVTAPLPVKPAPDEPPMLHTHGKPDVASAKRKSVHQKALQKALDEATSHKQPKTKKTSRRQKLSHKLRVSNRTVNIAAASLAVMLLSGFVAYQNIPNLSMQIATARAGVNGTLPGYQPAGFGLVGPIRYQNGQIVLNYASRSDERQFKVSQTATQWNSDTLQENFLVSAEKTYQTFQNSGKTIYIYDDNNATWVDGGVWYQIEGNSALSNDQLLRMAASM